MTNNGGDTVTRIDPENPRVVGEPISVGERPGGIAVGAGAVWVVNRDGTLTRIDPDAV